MDVLVAGGHGQIARRLLRLLAREGHAPRGLIRNPDHAADLEADGAEPVVFDLESGGDLAPHLQGVDALVFAAGAGPGSGAARKRTLDLGGALRCIEAAQHAGVDRFLMVSSMGTDAIPADGPMRPYLEAKRDADAALTESGLRWTIVRPGRLTDAPGTGTVTLAPHLPRGDIPRDDVALVLYLCLTADNTIGGTFDLLAGDQPAEVAVRAFSSR